MTKLVYQVASNLNELWSNEFIIEFKDDRIFFKPIQNKNFPLSIEFITVSNMQDDFSTLFLKEADNLLVQRWNTLSQEQIEKVPLLILNINGILYCIIQYVTGKWFYEDITLPKNKLVIEYQLEKLPRVYETLIVMQWNDFFQLNNTYNKRQYLKKTY